MVKCTKYKSEEEAIKKTDEWSTVGTNLSLQEFLDFSKEEFLAYIRRDMVFDED
jgi:hypothetical protein